MISVNLAHGGKYYIKREKKIYANFGGIAEYLNNERIYLAGIDMIDKFITEINITSPTGIMHLQKKDPMICKRIANEFIKIIKSYHDE